MTLTTAQRLAQAQEKQQAIAAREAAIRQELEEIQKQQGDNQREIEELAKRQQIITANVEALAALEPDLFEEIMAIATDARSKTQQQPKKPGSQTEQSTQSPEQPPEEVSENIIPDCIIGCLKDCLEPYCLGVDEVWENAVLLNDYDNPDASPGTLFYEKNEFRPSQNLLNWLETQKSKWEEMKAEIEEAIEAATPKNVEPEAKASEDKPDIFENPYQPLASNTFILIDPDNPLEGKVKIGQDMPRSYEVVQHGKEMILEIVTSGSGSTVKSSWNWETHYPKKYQPATRLILKHYSKTPELLAAFHEKYPDAADLTVKAKKAKKDLFLSHSNDPDPDTDPVGEGETPGFRLGVGA